MYDSIESLSHQIHWHPGAGEDGWEQNDHVGEADLLRGDQRAYEQSHANEAATHDEEDQENKACAPSDLEPEEASDAIDDGDLDDSDSEVSRLIRDEGGFQLSPELGTDPSVYYLPPER